MPAKAPLASDTVATKIATLGKKVRERRKALGVNATSAAEAANMSRVTLYRIENGEPSVTVGAYMNVLAALGMDIDIVCPDSQSDVSKAGWIPARIHLADYPQLKQLAWQVLGTDHVTPAEALNIYERNWRHLDLKLMGPQERQLVDALRLAFSQSAGNV